jgi:type IV pilus assembly protein PilA
MQDIITRLRAKKDDEGFTLIELLVVVVIIGVLVAIAVPVYLNYRQGAADKSAQSDVRGAVSAVEQWYTDNGNTYPSSTLASQTASFYLGGTTTPAASGSAAGQVTLSDKTVMTYIPVTASGATVATSYRLCAKNTGGSGKTYLYDSSTGGSVKAATGTISMTNCA